MKGLLSKIWSEVKQRGNALADCLGTCVGRQKIQLKYRTPYRHIRCHHSQWGRRLEGWPNTAARLVGWRRVCYDSVCDGRFVTPVFSVLYPAASWWNCHLLLYSRNAHNHPSWATSCKEGMACHSSRPMPSLWLQQPGRTLVVRRYTTYFSLVIL